MPVTSLAIYFLLYQLQRITMPEQVYLADNLAHFPYQVQDEPLFIIHQIDIIVSVAGSNLMQTFKEVRSYFNMLAGPPANMIRL